MIGKVDNKGKVGKAFVKYEALIDRKLPVLQVSAMVWVGGRNL
jgi:hypothetical protein